MLLDLTVHDGHYVRGIACGDLGLNVIDRQPRKTWQNVRSSRVFDEIGNRLNVDRHVSENARMLPRYLCRPPSPSLAPRSDRRPPRAVRARARPLIPRPRA